VPGDGVTGKVITGAVSARQSPRRLSMPVVLTPVDRALVMADVERTTRADTVAEAPGCDGQNVRRASEQGSVTGACQTLRVQGSAGLPYTPNPVKVQSSFVFSGQGQNDYEKA
jgi:hypothetical protein